MTWNEPDLDSEIVPVHPLPRTTVSARLMFWPESVPVPVTWTLDAALVSANALVMIAVALLSASGSAVADADVVARVVAELLLATLELPDVPHAASPTAS